MAIDTADRTEVRHYQNYIGGEWVDAASGETFDVDQPVDRRGRRHRPEGRARGRPARDRRGAGDASTPASGANMDPDERERIMRSVVDSFTEHEDELASSSRSQAGMTMRATSTVVIGYCISHWDYFARQADAAAAGGARAGRVPDALATTSCCASRSASAPGSSPGTSRW